jgi:hypothetical protein
VTDGRGYSATSTNNFLVTSGAAAITTSPLASYTLAITSVEWWNNSTDRFDPSSSAPGACIPDYKNGIQHLTVTATSQNHTSSKIDFVVVNPATAKPIITTANNVVFTVGTAGTFTVTATGYPAPTVTDASFGGPTPCSASALPSNVTFTTNINGTATIAGTPASGTSGPYAVCINAVNAAGSSTQAFTLTVQVAQLVFTTQPGGGANGAAWTTQPQVTVVDALGNPITSGVNATASITLAINSQPGAGAILSCASNPLAASNGVATFAGCKIVGIAGSYTLNAAAPGLATIVSAPLNIMVGAAAQVAFTVQTGGGASGAVWGTQPQVTVQDSGGNTVATSSASITLAINSQPTSGAALSCTPNTNSQTATNGVATFVGCQITGTAGGYTLKATGATFVTTSFAFPIGSGLAAKLAFSTQPPAAGTNGSPWGTQPRVTVQDVSGNPVTSGPGSNASITVAINSQPGSGATLSCATNPFAATGGTAAFSGCTIIGKSGAYTLVATASGLTNAISTSITIAFGSPTHLEFTAPPGGGTGGTAWTLQPQVAIQDSGGNIVTTAPNTPLLMTIANNAGGGTLSCTANPKTTASGVASFAGCKIDKIGIGYTLRASGGAFASADSSAFNVTVGSVAQFAVVPSTMTPQAGTAFTVSLAAQDAGGNPVTSYAGSNTIGWSSAMTSPAGTVPVYPITAVNFSGGISTTTLNATFYAAGANTLTATGTSPAGSGSAAVTVSASSASHLAWTSTSNTAGSLTGSCYFTCTYTAVGGPGTTFMSKVSLTDNFGNAVPNAGSAFAVTVSASAGTFTGSAVVTIPTGGSESNSGGDATGSGRITFNSRKGSWTTDTLSMSGLSYTPATASFSK